MNWISVKERMPEKEKLVLLFSQSNQRLSGSLIFLGSLEEDYDEVEGTLVFKESECCNSKDPYVTHWMPLPEPPKEQERAIAWKKEKKDHVTECRYFSKHEVFMDFYDCYCPTYKPKE